jgi:hypothetical protein
MVGTSYRTSGVIGALCLIGGTALLIALDLHSGLAPLAAAGILVGIGMGFCNQTFLVAVQSSVGWNERGIATASILFLRTIGMALGAAIGGAILNFGVARYAPEAGDTLDRLLEQGRRLGLGANVIAQLSEAIANALHDVYIVAGLFGLLSLATALLVPAHLSPVHPAKN